MRMHRFIRPLLLALMLFSVSALSFGGVFVSVSVGPPPIPVYAQPACPGAGYIWTPGYWAWGDDGYYWVPGTWVIAPEPGLLWTPGYWGWSGGVYLWHGGYWGPHVGWYGGINYGFGYVGHGYEGGEWRGRNFYYNRSVNNVNVTNVTNVYNKTVIVNNNNRVSYNGGQGGIHAEPNARERQWQNERHMEPTHNQVEHQNFAAQNRDLRASANHGRPAIAATSRPGDFSPRGVVGARAAGGPVNRAALTATPRNMPAARGNAAGGNNAGARGGANVPRPNNAGPRDANAGARNAPRPSAGPPSRSDAQRNNGPAQQQRGGYQQQQQRGSYQPQQRQERQAGNSRGPASAPAPHANTAPSHGGNAPAQHGNEKPHR